jgi:hypothetical protein
MPFGTRPARTIQDPVIEPLWPGRRILVHVRVGRSEPDSIVIVDEDGLQLAGHPEIRAALLVAVLAAEIVLDGYLIELPRREARGMFASGPAVAVPGLPQAARQLVLGSWGGGPDRRRPSGPPARAGALTADASAGDDRPPSVRPVAALVAVDLLALDADVLLDVPLLERKRLLDSALEVGELVRLGPHVRPPAEAWYGQWRAYGFSGIAVKSANSRYNPGRPSNEWTIAPLPRS